jgi:hypothetical protein
MFTVRTKAGRVVGRYATKAEAEACVRQGRTERSPGGRSAAKVSYQFPNYETHAFRSSEDAAREYRQLAEHHRRNARAYLKAAEERETRNGKSDKACATWRKRAVSELKIAQRAQNEALVLASQGSPVRGVERTRLLRVHADVSRKLWAKSPGARGLKDPPPPGAKVRLTGHYLKSTGQQRGSEGASRWTVLGTSGNFVIVDEPADTRYFTSEEIAADPSLKWRRIHRGNLEIVGAKPKASDYP